jgi:hypothetical protein
MANEPTIPIAIRLPPEQVDAVDAFAARMTSENQYGVKFNRTDALRALLTVAIATVGQMQNANPTTKKGASSK